MKTFTFGLVLALVSGAVACSGGATNVQSTTAQSAATKAPLAVQVSGPLRGIADACADVPLRPDQRTSIEGELKQARKDYESEPPQLSSLRVWIRARARIEGARVLNSQHRTRVRTAHRRGIRLGTNG